MSEPQLPALMDRLRPVVAKRVGSALGVWGEAGIGKTHTVRALLAELPCRSVRLPAEAPLAAWVEALPRPRKLAAWADRSLKGLAAGRTLVPSDLSAALGALLGELAPFVLHVEDVHAAAVPRLELLRQLARLTHTLRGVAILVSSRIEPPEPFVSIKLQPLTLDASAHMLEREVGAALPPTAIAWIFGKAAGNPLYTLEFFRYLARQGFLWNDGRRWHWRAPVDAFLPGTVEALVEELIDRARQRADQRYVLESRALLGEAASPAVWAYVARLREDELETVIRRLAQGGVFGGSDFAHPLFREIALRTLAPERRRDLARRAVNALQDDPGRAARFVDDAALPDAQVLALLTAAAARTPDAARAARFRAHATRYARGPQRARLALEAARVLQQHDLPEAVRLAGLALGEGPPDPEALRLYAQLLARSGRIGEVEVLLAALPEADRQRIRPPALLLVSHHVAGDHHAAWTLWEAHPELHAQATPELLRAAAAAALATGRMPEAQALTQEGCAAAADDALRCEFLSLRSLIAYHAGDPRTADATIREALALLDTMDAPLLRATALLNRAAFLRMMGEYGQMGSCLEECLHLRQAAGDGKANAFALAALAELRIEQGRFDQAEELLAEAIGTLELYGPSRYLINAHAMASLLGTAQGTSLSRLTALKHGETALAGARRMGSPRVVCEMLFDASVANTYGGHPERGLALALESQALHAAAGDAPSDRYRTLWALALAREASGSTDEAVDLLEQAARLADATEGAIDAHKIGLELDRLRGDAASARRRLAWFEARGLGNGAGMARRYFPQLEAATPARDEAPPRLEVLGPMQLRGATVALVRGEQRRRLLALLLEARVAGRGSVAKLALLDELYPDQDELKAGSSLKELVRGLRAGLGPGLVATTPEGYALGACTSDLELFLASPDAALWRGPYLAGLEPDGPVADGLYLALQRHADALRATDPAEAARLGRILVEAEPYRPDYLATSLRALRAAGNHRSLERHYQAARARLAELGEELPARWQAFLEGT